MEITQPYRVTIAQYCYILVQKKIFTLMIKELQEPILFEYNFRPFEDSEIFMRHEKDNHITLQLNLSEIPHNHRYSIEAAQKMVTIPISIPQHISEPDEGGFSKGINPIQFKGLFTKVKKLSPAKIEVSIEKKLATMLVARFLL